MTEVRQGLRFGGCCGQGGGKRKGEDMRDWMRHSWSAPVSTANGADDRGAITGTRSLCCRMTILATVLQLRRVLEEPVGEG